MALVVPQPPNPPRRNLAVRRESANLATAPSATIGALGMLHSAEFEFAPGRRHVKMSRHAQRLHWMARCACLALIAIYICSVRWTVILWFKNAPTLAILHGQLSLCYWHSPFTSQETKIDIFRDPEAPVRLWFSGRNHDPRFFAWEIPIWVLLSPLLPLCLIRLPSSVRSANACPRCQYDLTGNASGRCPECGEIVAA